MRYREFFGENEVCNDKLFRRDFCEALALAIREATGHPLHALRNGDEIAGVVNRLSDDAFITYRGVQSRVEVLQNFGHSPVDPGWDFEPISMVCLYRHLKRHRTKRLTKHVLTKARRLAQDIIAQFSIGRIVDNDGV